MKTSTLILIPVVALLAACSKQPATCDSPEATALVNQTILKIAKVPDGVFDAKFSQVITHSATNEETACEAIVTYSLKDATKSFWTNAVQKLESVNKIAPETGFPLNRYVPSADDAMFYAQHQATLDDHAMLILLGATSYAESFRKYLKKMSEDESHPEHIIFLANSYALADAYKDTEKQTGVHNDAYASQSKFIAKYTVKLVTVNGQKKNYVTSYAVGPFDALSYINNAVAKVLQ